MHSWRTLVLPYFGYEKAVYNAYDFSEPWNGPNNRKLADKIGTEGFRCPSRHTHDASVTDYVVVVGDGTAFPGSKSVSLSDIRDGRDTILVAEFANSDILWNEPRDLRFDTMSFQVNDKKSPSISSAHPHCALVSMLSACSGQVVSDRVPPSDVRALITIDAGERVAADRLWDPR